jgi:hypothetical protein
MLPADRHIGQAQITAARPSDEHILSEEVKDPVGGAGFLDDEELHRSSWERL